MNVYEKFEIVYEKWFSYLEKVFCRCTCQGRKIRNEFITLLRFKKHTQWTINGGLEYC